MKSRSETNLVAPASARPVLTHEGQTYERRGGGWVVQHLRAPAAVSHRLDVLARQDLELWSRCLAQDAHDSAGGRLLPAVPELRDLLLRGAGLEPVGHVSPGRQSGKVSQRRKGEALSWQVRGDDLVFSCDLQTGWRQTKTAWRFGESIDLPLNADADLRCVVGIYENTWVRAFQRRYTTASGEWLGGDEHSLEMVGPHFGVHDLGRGIRLTGWPGGCDLLVPVFRGRELNPDLSWQCTGSRLQTSVVDYLHETPVLVSASSAVSRPFRFGFRATVVITKRTGLAQTVREFDTPLPSAGLPSLGKRR